jgi:ligand-binding sensor domain-containing protein
MVWHWKWGNALRLWTTYTTADGMSNRIVRSIFQDEEGLLWFGTSSGISMFDGNSWTTFEEEGISSSRIRSIF